MFATTSRTVTPTRALREPWHPSKQVLIGLLIACLAVVGGLAFWQTSTATQAVLVTTRDLPAGARLTPADIAVSHVRLDDTLYRAAVPASEQMNVVGRQVSQPVGAHQLLARAQLSPRAPLAPGQVVMTVPVAAESAVGGRLRPGDTVEVVATIAKGRPESRSVVVLPRVAVYEVNFDQRLAAVNTAAAGPQSGDAVDRHANGQLASVALLLNADQILPLAQARWSSDLDLVLLPPES